MRKFLSSNETKYRLLRTILQGIIGVLIANVDLLVGSFNIPVAYKPMIVALVMAILSPVMSELGVKQEDKMSDYEEDFDEEYEEGDIDGTSDDSTEESEI